MNTQRVAASAVIQSPAERIYTILADYHHGHPYILPRQYFSFLEVEQGGIGAGTRIRFQMRAAGTTRDFRANVTEPEPGRVLVETTLEARSAGSDPQPETLTIFSVEAREPGRSALVTITTELPIRAGVAGLLERFLNTAFLSRVYTQELKLLAALAKERSKDSGVSASTGA